MICLRLDQHVMAPNMRVQRTRSASLRSPLTRGPLGRPDSTLSPVRWRLCPDVEFDFGRRQKAVNYLRGPSFSAALEHSNSLARGRHDVAA